MRALILLSIVAVAFANQQCGENEHFESCGTACPLTCDNHDKPPKFCVAMCKIGCQCDEGFVRNGEGNCVRKFDCPPRTEESCGANERFEECGTACPLTCDNHDNPPRICTMQCVTGCHCKPGFVRHNNGECVRKEECPPRAEQKCGANERFEECGTACPLTCDNHDNPPKICTKQCVIGCHCKPGFVRHNNGECVRKEECPPRTEQNCGANAEFQECGTACPVTCDNHDNPPRICTLQCVIGCQCKPGFVRHSNGECVRAEDCPARNEQKCGANEQFETCGTACPLTCDNHANPPKFCTKQCVIGCHCKPGFVRHSNGKCVRIDECESRSEDVSVCSQGKIVGPCKASIPRWFFNQQTGQCEEFIYGGCRGNGNNFENQETCHSLCAARAAPTACLADKVEGPCRGYFERWYFNGETQECEKFIYGGCGGNSNNFESKEDCHAVCAA